MLTPSITLKYLRNFPPSNVTETFLQTEETSKIMFGRMFFTSGIDMAKQLNAKDACGHQGVLG